MLGLLALSFGNVWKVKAPGISLIALFLFLGIFAVFNGTLTSNCLRESGYYCIRITEETVGEGYKVK